MSDDRSQDDTHANLRRTPWLPTVVGMMILGAMEVYIPSVGQTPNATSIHPRMAGTVVVQ
jgi:hypothetical protein